MTAIAIAVLAAVTTACTLHALAPEVSDPRNAKSQGYAAIVAGFCAGLIVYIALA